MTGKISRVVAERGFGLITGEDGQDYFFHRRALSSCGHTPKTRAYSVVPLVGPNGNILGLGRPSSST